MGIDFQGCLVSLHHTDEKLKSEQRGKPLVFWQGVDSGNKEANTEGAT